EAAEHEVDLRRDLGECPRTGSFDELRNGPSLGQLHRVPRDVAAAVPVIDGDDRRMGELRRQLCLAAKTRHGSLVARNVRVEQLERDFPPETEIANTPHRAE